LKNGGILRISTKVTLIYNNPHQANSDKAELRRQTGVSAGLGSRNPKSSGGLAKPLEAYKDSERYMSIPITLSVNGVKRTIEVDDPRLTLLDLLRERLHLTGTKKGCDRGQCGACTVIVQGRRINSCLALAISLDGADIRTIEGVAQGERLHPVQEAFIAHDGLQCGFCTPGQIMSAIGLIQEGQAGDDPERIREGMSGNLCRCAAYQGITEAVLEAQKALGAAGQRKVA
jgi:xanthine dehydrogenase YagT iron-sulfur-binding subunit